MVALLVGAVLAAAFALAMEVGPLRGCRAVPPRELPSGAVPGTGTEDVAGGAKQVVWGDGPDRIEQIVGIDYNSGVDTETIAAVDVGGRPATLYRFVESEVQSNASGILAISFESDGCSITVFLPVGMTVEEAKGYATRF